ncbi:MAG TPA: alkaline phosphatase family protein, partial [Opitutus sp.]|nr:alkaline phosphatase family protein [Opitutus sp.]
MPPRRFPLSRVAALLAVPSSLVAADPALVLVISIDQFRADYLTRFRPHFVADGFNLLLERGANFTDCHYRHALTKTGPGHA